MRSTNCTQDKPFLSSSTSAILLALGLCSSILWGESRAQDPHDPGQPDTIWVECDAKAVHDSGGWVAYSIYLKTDNQAAGTDIAALDLPLYISSSNSGDSARVDTSLNLVFGNSAFNDSGAFLSVDVDSLNLDGSLGLGAVDFSAGGPKNGTFLVAQVWIHLSDSTTVTIDTTTRGTHQLLLSTSDAVGYVPIWKKASCAVCVHSSPAGDANCSGEITLADVIYLVNYIFRKGASPCCLVLGDADCSGAITLADVITLVNYIFKKSPSAPQYCP